MRRCRSRIFRRSFFNGLLFSLAAAFPVMLVAGFAVVAVPSAAAKELCSVRSGSRTVPLVELYTSEGCSSCPPADRWLSQQIRRAGDAANWLAFHVDYWDDLGWPDRFASPAYSERQRRRLAAHGDATVYTPQVMVGRQIRAAWRNDSEFSRRLAEASPPAGVGLALSLQRDPDGLALRIGASRADSHAPAPVTPAMIWLAESVDGQVTDVRAGENGGVRLHHDRVVRRLWGPWPLPQRSFGLRIAVPQASAASDFTVFVQNAQGVTLQSLRLPGDCRQ